MPPYPSLSIFCIVPADVSLTGRRAYEQAMQQMQGRDVAVDS